jgi:hypothetical protein
MQIKEKLPYFTLNLLPTKDYSQILIKNVHQRAKKSENEI